jgi:hypothetical protein
MSRFGSIDGVLVQWGDRLFYPGNRIVHAKGDPRLRSGAAAQRASALRARIEATMVRGAPQVMVKVTGGGRGMAAIAAHLRYISKHGRLDIEDDRGQSVRGKDAIRELVDEWRFSGSLIEDVSVRREAFNIMLSMRRGSADASIVQRAAREFAQTELRGHKYVMVVHDHQANPHVHISVRAESNRGSRLNPRKGDLHRWRETFAAKLRGYGIDAEATRQATRGATRNYDPIWRTKARAGNRLRSERPRVKLGAAALSSRQSAAASWRHIAAALAGSTHTRDREIAAAIDRQITQFERELKRSNVAGVDREVRR